MKTMMCISDAPGEANPVISAIRSDCQVMKRHALKGKTLGCFCKPYPRHGDVISDYLNGLDTGNQSFLIIKLIKYGNI